MDSKFMDAVCLASVEILGEKETFQVLKDFGVSSFSTLDASHFSLERFGQALAKRYDVQSAMGLLIRIGRASLIFLRRYFSDIADLGGIDNRLKPVDKRFPYSLNVLADKAGEGLGSQIQAAAVDSATFLWRLRAVNTALEPYYHFGLLEEFCGWLDSRKDYRIIYAADGGMGEFAELTIQVKEKE